MKKIPVILRVLIFFAVFVLLNYWITRAYVRYTRQPFVYEANRRGFETVMAETRFLVVGDSHTLCSVFTPKIPGAFNFSTNGESYIHSYYKMAHYLESGDLELDVVVMPVSIHTFSGLRVQNITKLDPAFWMQYIDYLQLGKESDQIWGFAGERFKAEFAYLGGLDEVFEIVHHSKIWLSDRLKVGFLQYKESFEDRGEEGMNEVAVNRAGYHLKDVAYIDPLVVEYFYRLLDLLEEEGVQIVLVSFPTTSKYQLAAAEYVQIEEHIAEMEALVEGRESVLLLDYLDMFPDRNDLFRDADHLNTEGAKILTQVLLADLQANGITWETDRQP